VDHGSVAVKIRVGGNGKTPQSGKGSNGEASQHGNMIMRNFKILSVSNACWWSGSEGFCRFSRLVSNFSGNGTSGPAA